jgi:hypothetical protein
MLKAKHIEFEWTHDTDNVNPTCWRTIGNGFSAYVLIPYDQGNYPAMERGTWLGVAQNKGVTGFASKDEAILYCEQVIREFAQVAVNRASNFLYSEDILIQSERKLDEQSKI